MNETIRKELETVEKYVREQGRNWRSNVW